MVWYALVETYGKGGSVCCGYASEQDNKHQPCAGAYPSKEEAKEAASLLYKLLKEGEIARRVTEEARE